MNKFSNDLINNFPEYLFNEINQKKISARHSGKDIIDLGTQVMNTKRQVIGILELCFFSLLEM